MAGIARVVVPGYRHHLTLRYNCRQWAWFGSDAPRLGYIPSCDVLLVVPSMFWQVIEQIR